jgi:hypothetical protein
VVGSCKHGNELSGSIKAGNFLASAETIAPSYNQIINY